MEQIPYFLYLLKKNMILCSIISSSSLNTTDLSKVEHVFRSESSVDLINFALDENEVFSSVNVLVLDDELSLTFRTKSSKYYERTENYFSQHYTERAKHPYDVYGVTAQTQEKKLGEFKFLPSTPPASVYVSRSTAYGYTVTISFYGHNLKSSESAKKN